METSENQNIFNYLIKKGFTVKAALESLILNHSGSRSLFATNIGQSHTAITKWLAGKYHNKEACHAIGIKNPWA
jgi:hypothetical protein